MGMRGGGLGLPTCDTIDSFQGLQTRRSKEAHRKKMEVARNSSVSLVSVHILVMNDSNIAIISSVAGSI